VCGTLKKGGGGRGGIQTMRVDSSDDEGKVKVQFFSAG
jgi:hypothetical protein